MMTPNDSVGAVLNWLSKLYFRSIFLRRSRRSLGGRHRPILPLKRWIAHFCSRLGEIVGREVLLALLKTFRRVHARQVEDIQGVSADIAVGLTCQCSKRISRDELR